MIILTLYNIISEKNSVTNNKQKIPIKNKTVVYLNGKFGFKYT
jgi:hypothetical protein